MELSAYLRAFDGLKNERLLRAEDVDGRYWIGLSESAEQDVLYECLVCGHPVESKDVIGFDQGDDIVYIGYICPVCYAWSRRPATNLEYCLFLESLAAAGGRRNRFHAGFAGEGGMEWAICRELCLGPEAV